MKRPDEGGSVDGDDLAHWRASFGMGATHMEGNADGDLDVDGRDFLTWQRQFGGAPPATAAAATSIPESHSLGLFAATFFELRPVQLFATSELRRATILLAWPLLLGGSASMRPTSSYGNVNSAATCQPWPRSGPFPRPCALALLLVVSSGLAQVRRRQR